MKTYIRSIEIPVKLEEAWNFFSSPSNLQRITPKHMGFEIISDAHNEKMYPGMIITYKVKPLLGIPLTWVTEITQVMEHFYFIDNQKAGPYKFWHHQHFFRKTDKGVEMTDIVNYAAPYGVIGRIMESIIIEKKVKEIFDYRENVILELFTGKSKK
ncbi:MAG: SRPBCC family protein [Bacteroidales bacterium]